MRPEVIPRQIIKIGEGLYEIDAIVVRTITVPDDEEYVQVVYIARDNKAIATTVFWDGAKWQFQFQGPEGSYADRHSQYTEFVSILRERRRVPYRRMKR